MTRRIPEMLLELFLPENAALAGDLAEEHQRRASPWWYWRQVLAAIAIVVASDVAAHKILLFRAVAVGWTTMWLFSFVAAEINRFMSGWLLDRLIVLFWTHPFPMIWATQLWFRPAMVLSFLLSGWVVGRLHRDHRAAMLVVFTLTVLGWTVYDDAMTVIRPSSIAAPYRFVDLIFTPMPLLIFVGGFWRSKRNITRRDGNEPATPRL